MAAQYSMPYAIAVALTGRPLDPLMFDEGAYSDPGLLRLASLVRVELHPEVENAYPDRLGGHLHITLKDGRILEKLRLQARGAGDDMIDREEILKKSAALCSPFMAKADMDRLFACVLSFEQLDDVAQMTHFMNRATGAADKKASVVVL